MKLQIPNRPQTATELIQTGFYIWLGSLRYSIPLALTLAVVNLIFTFILQSLGVQYTQGDHPSIEYTGSVGLLNVSVVLFISLFLILNAAMIYCIDRVVHNEFLPYRTALWFGLRKAFLFFLVSLLCGLAIVAGLIVLIVPGIAISVYIMFAPYIIVINDKGIMDAIRESFRLVSGNWWHTASAFCMLMLIFLCVFILLVLAMIIIDMFLAALFKILFGAFLIHHQEYLNVVSNGIVIMVCYPLSYAFLMALLYDLRIRKNEDTKYQNFQA